MRKMLFIILLAVIIIVAIFTLKTKNKKSNNEVINYNIETFNSNKEDYTTINKIIENEEIKQIKNQIKMNISDSNGPFNFYILPVKMNGNECNTIEYKKFFDEYNHEYDGIITSIPKNTRIQFSSNIVKKIINAKFDNSQTISTLHYEEKDSIYHFEIKDSGVYVIECECDNDTVVNIVFQVFAN